MLSLSQKIILDTLGKNPNITDLELAKKAKYKNHNYISKVKNKILFTKGYLSIPKYNVDTRNISNNKIKRIIYILLFNKNIKYDYIINTLEKIEPWSFYYPLEEGIFNQLLYSVYSTDNKKIENIISYLQKKNIVYYYNKYELSNPFTTINPNFLTTDKRNINLYPNELQFNKLTNTQEIKSNKIKLNLLDTRLIMHLQTDKSAYSISKIMKIDAKKKIDGKYPYIFGYNSWRYSYEKLLDNNIIKKYYSIFPIPRIQCSHFFLLFRCENDKDTKNVAHNLGSNSRILQTGSFVKSLNKENYGKNYWLSHIRSHPIFRERIIELLEKNQVNEKVKLNIRSYHVHNNQKYPAKEINFFNEQSISLEEKYFDVKTQTLNYDYDEYFKNIKESIEKEKKLDI